VLAARPPLYGVSGRIIGPSGYEHGHAVSELVVEREVAGAIVATDAELRRLRSAQGVLDAPLSGPDLDVFLGCPRTPDVIEVVEGGGVLAYEIELSSKGRARREAILAAYAVSEYTEVEWIVPNARLAALLGVEIEEMGLNGFMTVRR